MMLFGMHQLKDFGCIEGRMCRKQIFQILTGNAFKQSGILDPFQQEAPVHCYQLMKALLNASFTSC